MIQLYDKFLQNIKKISCIVLQRLTLGLGTPNSCTNYVVADDTRLKTWSPKFVLQQQLAQSDILNLPCKSVLATIEQWKQFVSFISPLSWLLHLKCLELIKYHICYHFFDHFKVPQRKGNPSTETHPLAPIAYPRWWKGIHLSSIALQNVQIVVQFKRCLHFLICYTKFKCSLSPWWSNDFYTDKPVNIGLTLVSKTS